MTWFRIALALITGGALATGWWWGLPTADPGDELPPAGEGPYLICTVPLAGGGLTARVGIYSDDPAPIELSVVGAPEATTTLNPEGLGGATVTVNDLAELGATPLLIEASGALGGAVIANSSEAVILSSCLRADPGPVALTGLETSGDLTAVLHFVNPFAQDAILALQIASELGVDTPGDLESIRVPAGTQIEVPLTRPLSGRQAISVEALATSGLAAMGAIGGGSSDLAAIEARPAALEWAFPLPAATLAGELHLRSVSDLIGDFRIDRMETAGVTEGVAEGALNPGELVVIPLSELLTAPGGLVVAATEPVVAGLVLDQAAGRFTISGGPGATGWAVPVTATQGQTSLWMLNVGAEATTVALSPLTAGGAIEPVTLEAGALIEVALPDLGGGGLLVESDQPLVVVAAAAQGEAIGATLATPLE